MKSKKPKAQSRKSSRRKNQKAPATKTSSKSTRLYSKLLTRTREAGEPQPEVFNKVPEIAVERFLQASIAHGAKKSSSQGQS